MVGLMLVKTQSSAAVWRSSSLAMNWIPENVAMGKMIPGLVNVYITMERSTIFDG